MSLPRVNHSVQYRSARATLARALVILALGAQAPLGLIALPSAPAPALAAIGLATLTATVTATVTPATAHAKPKWKSFAGQRLRITRFGGILWDADPKAKAYGSVNVGDVVTATGEENPDGDWLRVNTKNNIEGWVPKASVTQLDLAPTAPAVVLDTGAKQPEAKVTFFSGDVKAGKTAKSMAPVKEGQLLAQGDIVQTGTDSRATLEFADLRTISLSPSTTITVTQLAAAALQGQGGKKGMAVTINLLAGQLYAFLANKLFPGEKFDVKGGTTVAGVRGTAFRAVVGEPGQPANTAKYEVLESTIDVTRGKDDRAVEQGFGLRAKPDEKVLPGVRALPPAPVATAPVNAAPLTERVDLRWEPVAKAKQYHVTISRDAGASRVLVEATTQEPRFAPETVTLPYGTVYWRVAAEDDEGFVGMPSATRELNVTFGEAR